MANDFDNTALNGVVREAWDTKVEDARYADGVIWKRVSNKSGIAKQKNDIIHVSINQKLNVVNVGADGSFSVFNYAVTTVDVTLDQWKAVPIRILDRAQSQAFWTPESDFPTQAGKAFANTYDASLAALHGSVASGNTVGSTSTPANFDKTLAQEAMLRLANQNVPLEELSWILDPIAFYNGLMNEVQLTQADAAGIGKSGLITGAVQNLMGAPVFLSTNIVRTGSPLVSKNLLLHKSAIAIAWQRNNEYENVRTTATGVLANLLVTQSLYGLNTIRSDHYVCINSAA